MFSIIADRFMRFSFFTRRMKYDERANYRFLYNEGISAEDIHPRLQAQFGEDTYSPRSVRRWRPRPRQRREDLHDEVRPGRPQVDFLDVRIMSLLGQ
jgi:transposase